LFNLVGTEEIVVVVAQEVLEFKEQLEQLIHLVVVEAAVLEKQALLQEHQSLEQVVALEEKFMARLLVLVVLVVAVEALLMGWDYLEQIILVVVVAADLIITDLIMLAELAEAE
jgi:uncharacterized protein (UPF0276 family)